MKAVGAKWAIRNAKPLVFSSPVDCDLTSFEPVHAKESCTTIVQNRMVIRIKRVGGFVNAAGPIFYSLLGLAR
jgi:hypothetical protein